MKKLFLSTVGMLVMAVCLSSLAEAAAEPYFREAMSALQSNDVPRGLHYLELAIADEPDNLRYASEYRQAIIRNKEFDRSISYFARLIAEHPTSANLHLNYGFAYVDKIPTAGSITQVLLANTALQEFSKAVESSTILDGLLHQRCELSVLAKNIQQGILGSGRSRESARNATPRPNEALLCAHLYSLGGRLLQDGEDG